MTTCRSSESAPEFAPCDGVPERWGRRERGSVWRDAVMSFLGTGEECARADLPDVYESNRVATRLRSAVASMGLMGSVAVHVRQKSVYLSRVG